MAVPSPTLRIKKTSTRAGPRLYLLCLEAWFSTAAPGAATWPAVTMLRDTDRSTSVDLGSTALPPRCVAMETDNPTFESENENGTRYPPAGPSNGGKSADGQQTPGPNSTISDDVRKYADMAIFGSTARADNFEHLEDVKQRTKVSAPPHPTADHPLPTGRHSAGPD